MKRFIGYTSLTALLLAAIASVNYAQNVVVLTGNDAKPVGGAITADDTSVALLVRYVGTSAGGGEVAVESDGNLTFTVNTSADTTFECPVNSTLGGVIDVSNAACNTLGEVCDAINGLNGAGGGGAPGSATQTDFRCVIINGRRSDTVDDMFLAASILPADSADGYAVLWDTSVALKSTLALLPPEAKKIGFYLGPPPSYTPKSKPFANTRTFVTWAWEDSSTCTGADTFSVLAENDSDPKSGTDQTLYGPIATNTTTAVEFSNLSHSPVFGNFGAKVLVREACASSFAGELLSAAGYQIPNSR